MARLAGSPDSQVLEPLGAAVSSKDNGPFVSVTTITRWLPSSTRPLDPMLVREELSLGIPKDLSRVIQSYPEALELKTY